MRGLIRVDLRGLTLRRKEMVVRAYNALGYSWGNEVTPPNLARGSLFLTNKSQLDTYEDIVNNRRIYTSDSIEPATHSYDDLMRMAYLDTDTAREITDLTSSSLGERIERLKAINLQLKELDNEATELLASIRNEGIEPTFERFTITPVSTINFNLNRGVIQ